MADSIDRLDEFSAGIGAMNLFGYIRDFADAIAATDANKSLQQLGNLQKVAARVAWGIASVGHAIKGKPDCDVILGLLPPPGSFSLNTSDEFTERLSKAAEYVRVHFEHNNLDLDDEEMVFLYEALARLATRFLHAYYADLYRLDRRAAENWTHRVFLLTMDFGCGRLRNLSQPAVVLPRILGM